MNRLFHNLGDASQPATPQYTEEPFKVVINQTLNSGDSFGDLRQAIDKDGDFVATDVYGTSTGSYTIQWFNAGHRAMSSAQIQNTNAIGTAQFPVPFGGVQYPAGGQIAYAITNTSGAGNTIQIVISGIKQRTQG